jgi:hypothetical protein
VRPLPSRITTSRIYNDTRHAWDFRHRHVSQKHAIRTDLCLMQQIAQTRSCQNTALKINAQHIVGKCIFGILGIFGLCTGSYGYGAPQAMPCVIVSSPLTNSKSVLCLLPQEIRNVHARCPPSRYSCRASTRGRIASVAMATMFLVLGVTMGAWPSPTLVPRGLCRRRSHPPPA